MKSPGSNIAADWDDLHVMKKTTDKLFGKDHVWSALAAGRFQLPFITRSAMMGGNVRAGLEDNPYSGQGERATSNAGQVRKIRRTFEYLDHEIAAPDEARSTLDLQGADKVGF